MAKSKGVSGYTHTQKQLNDYANQHNPNNRAYKARIATDNVTKKALIKREAVRQAKSRAKLEAECGVLYPLDWMCYSNPYDFD